MNRDTNQTLREIRLHLASADERLRRLVNPALDRVAPTLPSESTDGASASALTEAVSSNNGGDA